MPGQEGGETQEPERLRILWFVVGARPIRQVTQALRRLIKQRNTSVWVINSLRSTQPISRQSQRMTLIVIIGSLSQPMCLCPEGDQTGACVRAGIAARRNSFSGEFHRRLSSAAVT